MAISNRGGALLAVMWLSAALSAIALSVATTVRGETERASTALDGARAYYLATGAIERAILYMQWGPQFTLPDGMSRYYSPGMPVLRMGFATGVVEVEVVPEAAKFNVNTAPPEDLFRLMLALGVPPDHARVIVESIVDWRTPGPTPLDTFYLSLTPSFRPRHASFEEIEELLLVRGMTPDLYYGSFSRADNQGRLIPHGGLKDCVSVFGARDSYDANTAHPAVLAAIGLPPVAVAALVERRRVMPFRNPGELGMFLQGAGDAAGRLRIGGNSIFTLRATARLRTGENQFSDLRRSVAAMVKFMPAGYDDTFHILRWYDSAWKM